MIETDTITARRYYPRVRTGLFKLEGGLNDNDQVCRLGVLYPRMDGHGNIIDAKVYINSVMQDRDNPTKAKESLSIRCNSLTEIHSFFVGYVLAIREYAMMKGIKYDKQELIKRVEAAWQGCYDSQVNRYKGD